MTTSKTTPSVQTGQSRIEHADVQFKHIYAIAVWTIDMDKIAYYYLFTVKGRYPLGAVKHLGYLLDASKTKV